jgi:nucleotide-binding universal stress UspA family protein
MQIILCPVDFSTHSAAAFKLVCGIAKPEQTKVVFLHVTGPGDKPLSLEESWLQRTEAGIRDSILSDNSIEFDHLTLAGDPVEVIVRAAERMQVDTIVMGTQGKTGLRRIIMGSVTQGVLSRVNCEVVTVRAALEGGD